jgi:hypothetical protein
VSPGKYGPDPGIGQGQSLLEADPAKLVMLRSAQFRADREVNLTGGAHRQVVAGDLARAIWGRLHEDLPLGKGQVGQARLFQDLPPGGGKRLLAGFHLTLGKIPILVAP